MKKAVLSVLILLSLGSQAQNVTFSKHSRIVKTADTPEMATAAGILQRYLSEATGYSFPESQSPSARKGDILLRDFKGLPEDSFRIGTENGSVVLESTRKGLIYAACDFLEQEMGMDYWETESTSSLREHRPKSTPARRSPPSAIGKPAITASATAR